MIKSNMIDLYLKVTCSSCGYESDLYRELKTRDEYIECERCGFELYQNGDIELFQNQCLYCGEYIDLDKIDCKECSKSAHFECIEKIYHNCIDIYSPDFVFLCCDCKISNEFYECINCYKIHSSECDSEKKIITSSFKCSDCLKEEETYIEEYIKEIESTFNFLGLNDLIEQESKLKYFQNSLKNPDMSILCSHFVSGNEDKAKKNLFNILDQKLLKSNFTGYYALTEKTKSVCFTELTIKGLIPHSENKKYSSFGLSFLKSYILNNGGSPALYISEKIIKDLNLPDKIKPFVNKIDLNNYDFHHEREWSVRNNAKIDKSNK